MKRMILGALMCAMMVSSVSAQTDSLQKRDFKHDATKREMIRDDRHFDGRHFDGRRFDDRRMEAKQYARIDKEVKQGKHGDELRKGECRHGAKAAQTVEERAQMKSKFLQDKLTLTNKQTEKLYKVFLEEGKSLEKQKSELEGKDDKQKGEAFGKLRANTDKQVKKILTEEEYAKYKEIEVSKKKRIRK